MLSAENNRLLTEVGPSTKMGQLLRRYWHPVAGVSEFEKTAIKPIKLFGEELVLFKTLKGTYGLIARRCAHRNADLAFGIVEECGLRCSYHGWEYDQTGQCTHQPFEETTFPAGKLRRATKLPAYPVQVKAGMLWVYMGPQPAPLLPDWEPFNWSNCFAQVAIATVPCNWLQCQENTVDPVHFEWMHNNQPQRAAGDMGPYSPKHLKLNFEEASYGIVSRRYREGADESAPLWSIGRAILWPNGWFLGHHFEWKVPIDDENTLFVNWVALHVPTEREPYTQKRIPTWYAPTVDIQGEWIMSHVNNQDIVAWVCQGRIADRTVERLGASDIGVTLLRNMFLQDLEAIGQGRDPRCLLRDASKNERIELPCIGKDGLMNGMSLEKMKADPVLGPFLRDFILLAGQPDEVRLEFEQVMGAERTDLKIHQLVYR
jgi:5,5'-dehydrodivanillate O-demethylase